MNGATTPGGRARTPQRVTPPAAPGDYLTPSDVADLYRVSIKTLRNWRHLGRGPAFVKVGGSVRYRRDAVEAFAS